MTLPQTAALAFLPLFVAIDPPMAVPFFLSVTEGASQEKKLSLLNEATLTAFVVALLFLAGGTFFFKAIGINENDLRVAGGLLLLLTACSSILITRTEKQQEVAEDVGIVPLGIPTIVGPAALTTIMVEVKSLGYLPTLISITINLFLVWICLKYSDQVVRIIGKKGLKLVAKLSTFLLVVIAVMMIRVGIKNLMTG